MKPCHLPGLTERPFPGGAVQLETSTVYPPRSSPFPPDLIIFRPALCKSFSEAVHSLRQRWDRAAILALFCGGAPGPDDFPADLLGDVDDFVVCPFNEVDFWLRVERFFPRDRATTAPGRSGAGRSRPRLESLVGESECMLRLFEKIAPLSQCNEAVLICGETGTGKEVVARAIHYRGLQQGKPFIPVNCGALPEHLFENELFGHARGAFTDASSAEKGLIAEAEGGTLFLDEVDSLTLAGQVKLLRFLENGEYRPLGSSQTRVARVRIIAATNADLRQRVKHRLFREDLYYRLNALTVSIPPLRERVEDIIHLARHFLARHAREQERVTREISSGALRKLMAYSWPGNVRELEGVILRALVLTSSRVLQSEDIDLPVDCPEEPEKTSLRQAKMSTIQAFERSYLTDLLATHRGNITQAAKAAGKARRTLQRLLRKYSLDRQSFEQ